MKLSQLHHLIAVAEAGTVRQAAKMLFLSQSSVTKSLQQLEESLGVELLHRGSHGVTPTAAGRALIARAKVIEAELREARNDIDSIMGAGSGEIKISMSPSVAMALAPQAIIEFKRTRPKISFHLQEGVYPDALHTVRTGEFDFAICLMPERPRDEGLSCVLLLPDRLTPAVRVKHPLTQSRKTLVDLVHADWVIYRRGPSGRDVFEQTFIAAGLEPPTSTIECTSFACALTMVERSDYITLVPKQLFSDRAARWGIVPIAMDAALPEWNIAVFYRSDHELSPVCQAFLQELQNVATNMLVHSRT
ncbi:LysR family transcriptional regulator [Noviherbaspirillum sp.]|uniref:LysR family transcriptional regulator n=1 Tax=Noviherbaspirillum sp. TaxID=1926288 RepID=UPI002B4A33A2|nr:LysR family transcriptional regulator [Noviherbaspirillum sp.]HJV81563.1 LysR family transcriptional regulator [Noviherbaspirillum sp.]